MTNPVTHVDGHLIWPGGHARKMTIRERILWKRGKLKAVPRGEKFFVPYARKKSKSFELLRGLKDVSTVTTENAEGSD